MGLRWPKGSRMVSGKSVSKGGGIPRVPAGSLLPEPRTALFALAKRSGQSQAASHRESQNFQR